LLLRSCSTSVDAGTLDVVGAVRSKRFAAPVNEVLRGARVVTLRLAFRVARLARASSTAC
jgi:hypothetical protein